VLLVLLVLLVVAPSACSSSPAEPPAAGPPSSSTSSAPGAEPTEPAATAGTPRLDPPADGDFEVLTLLQDEAAPRDASAGGGYAPPVLGDDVIVILPRSQLLTVLDRGSGEVRWQERLPLLREYPRAPREPQDLCRIAELPPGASVVTVLLGRNCSTFLHYDLATGELLDQQQQIGDLGVSEIIPTFSVGRRTFWFDPAADLYRFDGAGGSDLVLDGTALGLGDEGVVEAATISGTDVVVLKLIAYGAPTAKDRYVGIRTTSDGDAEVVWSRRAGPLFEQASPLADLATRQSVFAPELGGALLTYVAQDGSAPRLSRFDPETGALDTGIIAARGLAGGLPGWSTAAGLGGLLPLDDAMLATSGYDNAGGRRDVTLYDYATGEVRWTYRPRSPYQEFGVPVTDPVGVSADGTLGYVAVGGDTDTLLVELDMSTGEETRSWSFPGEVTEAVTSSEGAEIMVAGDRMVWTERSSFTLDDTFGAVLSLPEAE
jgi:hypothetical protein